MALVHPTAQISPTKLEIVRDWLAQTSWFDGDPAAVDGHRRFTYRFDDPAGEVGVESVLVNAGDEVFQLPLTYRGEPLEDGELLTTMEHSALGPRWIYFGLSDPVLVTAFVTAITTSGSSVGLTFEHEGRTQSTETRVRARGTGSDEAPGDLSVEAVRKGNGSTAVVTEAGVLTVSHVLAPSARTPASAAEGSVLLGSWEGLSSDVELARWEPARLD